MVGWSFSGGLLSIAENFIFCANLYDRLHDQVDLLVAFVITYPVLFQVFFSSYIFNANVMVKVATRQADNPVSRSISLSWTGFEKIAVFCELLNLGFVKAPYANSGTRVVLLLLVVSRLMYSTNRSQ